MEAGAKVSPLVTKSAKKGEGTAKSLPEQPHVDKVTWYVVLVSIVAASGGAVYGYGIGISGGVSSMNTFLGKFYPNVLNAKAENSYCQFNDQGLQLFTSSLFLSALISSLFAGYVTQNLGRRPSMLVGGLSFLTGAVLNAAAVDLGMLITGRLILGVGVGFANQVVPLYLSEMAPARLRGALNVSFQLATTLGILAANLINYADGKPANGWRVSLGLAAIPASILTLGGIFLPETPTNLIERGRYEEGKAVLQKVRGTTDVDIEYDNIVFSCYQTADFKSPKKTLINLFRRKRLPQLAVATFIPFFQQVTGINAIMFYAPIIFETMGLGKSAALYSAVILGLVNVISTFLSILTVDRLGRKVLFIQGGIQMFFSQVIIGAILKYKLPLAVDAALDKSYAMVVVVLICIYVAGFAWSWGPLGWLVPSEVFPLDIRSAAQSLTVSVNFFFAFALAQGFLSMLCAFRWVIFYFFGAWVFIMTLYVIFFLPETKGRRLEEIEVIWTQHWFWKRFVEETVIPISSNVPGNVSSVGSSPVSAFEPELDSKE
jgi:sugar porter (SP) family MFS transporter